MERLHDLSDESLLDELQRRLSKKDQALEAQLRLVSELENLNEKLREVERVKSGFLSNIRNEINNPLTAILGLSLQIIGNGTAQPEKTQRAARLINKEAFSLDFQLRNIFSAGEIEAGEVSVQPAIVNVHELILNQIRYFQFKANQNNVAVSYAPLADVNFRTDGAMLAAIVMNLLANAIEYSNHGGVVTLGCTLFQHELLLSVQNYGKEIHPDHVKRVFQRFVQMETGSTKHHQGHGLGLSIVKEFTDLLNGTIAIRSLEGATIVTVRLPAFSLDDTPAGFSPHGEELLFDEGEVL